MTAYREHVFEFAVVLHQLRQPFLVTYLRVGMLTPSSAVHYTIASIDDGLHTSTDEHFGEWKKLTRRTMDEDMNLSLACVCVCVCVCVCGRVWACVCVCESPRPDVS